MKKSFKGRVVGNENDILTHFGMQTGRDLFTDNSFKIYFTYMPHEVVGFVIILIELKYSYFILFTLVTVIIIKENSSIGWLWKRVAMGNSVRKPRALTRIQTIK